MIRFIAIWIMKNRLKEAEGAQKRLNNRIVIRAYEDMIRSFKHTINFLEAHR